MRDSQARFSGVKGTKNADRPLSAGETEFREQVHSQSEIGNQGLARLLPGPLRVSLHALYPSSDALIHPNGTLPRAIILCRPLVHIATPPLFVKISCLSIPTLLFCSTVSALSQNTAEIELPEVVVSARASLTVPSLEAARAEVAETVPGGAEVIDSEAFRKARAITIRDALEFAPGVFIQPRFGAEESRISIRGSGIQRTFHGRGITLLQDGVPLNLADGGFDFQAIDPLTARYVEVYRGANALEYGALTLGGAVNFVSFTGHDASPVGARVTYGSFNTFQGQISSGMVRGLFDYYFSLSHFFTDGFREHSQQSAQRLFANLGYRINPELETRFYFIYLQSDSELPGAVTKEQLEADPTRAQRNALAPRFDTVDSDWKRDYTLLRIANKTTFERDDHRLSLSTFWTHKDLNHPILMVIDQNSNDFGFNLRYDNGGDLLGFRNRFTLGFMPVYGIVQDNRYANLLGARGTKISDNEQTALNLNLYGENAFYFLPNVAFIAGAQVAYAQRKNRDDFPATPGRFNTGSTQDWWGFSPKAGFLWEVTQKAQAFINLSRSFEPPSFGELTAPATGAAGLIGLEAQTATTLEIGTRGEAGRVRWDLAWYHAWVDDELLEYEIAPGLTQTINGGRTIHQGIEAALEIDLFRDLFGGVCPGDSLLLRQVYLWNDFRFDGDPEFGNHALPGVPRHSYRAEVLYEHPSGFFAGPNLEWVPEKYNVDSAETLFADPYALVGFKVGYRTARGFSFFLEGKNLTDKHYAATTGVISRATLSNRAQFLPGDGRSFYAGIECRW